MEMRGKANIVAIMSCALFLATAFGGCIGTAADFEILAAINGNSGNGDAARITVPYSMLGDQFAYATRVSGAITIDHETISLNETYEPFHYSSVDTETNGFCDTFMNKHSAWAIRTAGGSTGKVIEKFNSVEYIDLDSNYCIGSEIYYEGIESSEYSGDKNITCHQKFFFSNLTLPYLEYQGKTISCKDGGDSDFTASDHKIVNGYDCLAVVKIDSDIKRAETIFKWEKFSSEETMRNGPVFVEVTSPISRLAVENSIPGKYYSDSIQKQRNGGSDKPIVSNLKTTFWLSQEVPYPILIERELMVERGNDSVRLCSYEILNYISGNAKLPFGECWCDCSNIDSGKIETAKWNGFAPEDGKDCDLAYPLSEALITVKSDTRGYEFRDYLKNHPEAYLQSAEYYVSVSYVGIPAGGFDGVIEKYYTWDLVFSDFDGNGFSVSTQKPKNLYLNIYHPYSNTYNGEMQTLIIPKENIPQNAPTIWGAMNIWHQTASPECTAYNGDMYGIKWGIKYDGFYDTGLEAVSDYFELTVGFYDWEYVYGGSPLQEVTYSETENGSYIKMDADSGRIIKICETNRYAENTEFKFPGYGSGEQKMNSNYEIENAIKFASSVTKEEAIAGAGAISIIAVLALLWPGIKSILCNVFVIPLYARFHGDETLESETRGKILKAVREGKGMNITQIMKKANVSWSSVIYHLSVLEREEYVLSVKKGRGRMFFPKESTASECERKAVLSNFSTAQIYEIIKANPGIVQKYISEEMGVTHTAVQWHVSRLKGARLIREERAGRNVQYFSDN
jgi:DNA-binding transcriptional ArsR family regulator